jgi:hypothetical protein
MRPRPSPQIASIWGSCLGSIEPESFAMLLVCQLIRPSSLRGSENQAIFATRSPTAIRYFRPFRLRLKQIPETSRSGTSTTRRTRSLFDLALPMGKVSADLKWVQPLPDVFCSSQFEWQCPLSGVKRTSPTLDATAARLHASCAHYSLIKILAGQ